MKTTFWKKWMLAAVAAVSAACLFVTPALAAGSATTEENPTQLSWAKMSTGEARYDAGANTMTFVSEEFKITPMLYSSRGEGAYADSPYAEYNDTEYRFTFNVKPNGSYDDFVLDDPDEGEWYAAFSFRNPSVGAAGQEWEATFASFFLLKENYTAIRISSGSTASSDALWFKIPRRVKGTDGTWKTDETCTDYLDGEPHDVAISLTENDRQITVRIDDKEVISVNLDTAEDGKYAAFEIEPTGGYMFQAMNCEATFSNIKIWGNDMEKNIVQPTGVELNKNTLAMEVGDTEYLRAKKIPADAESEIVWESSDPTVATVNETGMVTALKAGSVTITAKIRGYEEIKAECAVTVAGGAPAEGGGCSCGGNEVAGIASLAVIAAAAGLKRLF